MKKHAVLTAISLATVLSLAAPPAHAVVAEPAPPAVVTLRDDPGGLPTSLAPAVDREIWYCLLILCKVRR